MKLIPESSAFSSLKKILNFDTMEGQVISRLESYSCKLIGPEKALYKKFSNSVSAGMSEMEILSPTREEVDNPFTLSPLGSSSFDLLYRNESEGVSKRRRTCSLNVPNALSSSTSSSSVSCSVGMDSESEGSIGEEDKILRKTLFYLVSTLNAAFYPDYDFSATSAREFSREHSSKQVMDTIERQLNIVSLSQLAGISTRLFKAIDEEVNLKECEIYTYNPDDISDPFSEDGCLWSLNYLFYNVKLKRIVFVSCQLVTKSTVPQNELSDYEMEFDEETDLY